MTENEPEVPSYVKRRSNFVLRALVDEMLEQVRLLDRASATMAPTNGPRLRRNSMR